jgi:ectoine hydroxylase-related dioxygenase (phytanoyl-CoA dioxygenase family)
MGSDIAEVLAVGGFAVIPAAMPSNVVTRLLLLFEPDPNAMGGDANGRYAMRNVAELIPEVREVADGFAVRSLIDPIMGREAFLVRSLFFDKTARANWKVAWHQDRSIAVQQRTEVAGFGPWSVKAGVAHVEPPVAILEAMLTMRLHLDDCDESNGPLRVIPGSHLRGRLTARQIRDEIAERPQVSCPVAAGGALLMRPLLLHASSPARAPRHRRVVHLEFACSRLPKGLRWACEAR